MSEFLTITSEIFPNGKTYAVNALKRQKCKVCGYENYPYGESYFYRVLFNSLINRLHEIPEYAELEKTYGGMCLCHGCTTELFRENPEVIDKIERIYP